MHDRLTKIQLVIFAVITALTLSVMAIFYLRLPATFGIGTYGVSADFGRPYSMERIQSPA